MTETVDKLDFIKIENFCSTKYNAKRMRIPASYWEKISAKDTSDKGLLSKTYFELLKLNSKKMKYPIKKSRRPEQTFPQRKYTHGK